MSRFPALGVTGGVGCGKSEVGRVLQRLGVALLDADALVHALLRDDADVKDGVVRLIGPAARAADGALDRKAIAAVVFADAEKRAALERLLHPRVWAAIQEWRTAQRAVQPCAALIPLLYEAGLTAGWDAIWCIAAEDAVVDARVRARGWDPAHLAARRAAQWPLAEKMERADAVIRNDGTLDELETTVKREWETFLERSA
ncbi:MAG TPA: dephospho-CoA kinase [Kiritimatiellia bacterium]|nr:dephospho-CoA kinase [Kiritimatiellia bacterium]